MRARLLVSAVMLSAVGCHPRQVVGENAKVEITFDVPHSVAADDVAIRATFTHDGRATEVGGFAENGRFVVRFAPREAGRWDWVIQADGGRGEREVRRGAFVAVPRPGDRGFVRVDPRDPHRLAFESGAPFWLLGENRINVYDPSWNFENASIEDYVARMAKNGMTTLRVFVFDDCHSETAPDGHQLGCLEPEVGRFDEREAKAFDRIMDAAEKNDVYVVLAPFALGFTPKPDTWKSWDDNPYSKIVKTPDEFFTNDAARAGAERRLRYVLDRWGYSEHLLAIDLLNEPEWDGPIPERTWIPWAESMARAVRARDPYGHLVTTGSVGLSNNIGPGDEKPWWSSPESSTVQWHLYGREYYEPHALAREMTKRVQDAWIFGKPVFCGEFAYGGEDKPGYEHTHDGIWAALMSGAGALAHSAPQFQIDSDEPMTDARAAHFRVLADFLHAMDAWGAVQPRRDVTATGVEAWSLRAPDGRRAIWLLGGERNEGVTVTIPDVPRGEWRIAWRDDVTGAPLAASNVSVRAGEPAIVAAPTFSRHAAALVTPL